MPQVVGAPYGSIGATSKANLRKNAIRVLKLKGVKR